MYNEKAERRREEGLEKKILGPDREEFIADYLDKKLRAPYSDGINGSKIFDLARIIDDNQLWDKTNAVAKAFEIIKTWAENPKITIDNINIFRFL